MVVKKAVKFLIVVLSGLAVMMAASFTVLAQETDEARNTLAEDIFWSPDSEYLIITGQNWYKKLPAPGQNPWLGFQTVRENQFFGGYCAETNVAAVLEDGKNVLLYDAGTLALKHTISLDFLAQTSACSPDGRTLLISSADDLAAYLYDSETGEHLQTLTGYSTAAPIYSVTFSPDGENLLWHSRATFQVQTVADGTLSEPVQFWDFVGVYALSPDSSVLAAFLPDEDAAEHIVVFYDTETATELGRVILGDLEINSIVFDGSGNFAILSGQTTLSRVDVSAYQLIATDTVMPGITGEEDSTDLIRKIRLSPNDHYLAVLTDTGRVMLLAFITE